MSDDVSTTPRRSLAQKHMASALWHIAPGQMQKQVETLKPVYDGFARVETHFSGISRGTESIVLAGAVPKSEWERMRAPMQQGDFPFPVKYGYAAAGQVVSGPDEMMGQNVFALHPHQDQFIAPQEALITVPDGVPLRRATLAANMETALNAVWDGGVGPGDRVAVIGAGIVGLLTASLLARLPAVDVYIVDIDAGKRDVSNAIGAAFVQPDACPQDCDCIFHTSATAAGLQTTLAAAGMEATVVEMSWYGERPIEVCLGGVMHSRRLRLISSQVGQVSPSHRSRWPYRRRLAKALELLTDSRLDVLVSNEISFDEAEHQMPHILSSDFRGLPPVVRYANALS